MNKTDNIKKHRDINSVRKWCKKLALDRLYIAFKTAVLHIRPSFFTQTIIVLRTGDSSA